MTINVDPLTEDYGSIQCKCVELKTLSDWYYFLIHFYSPEKETLTAKWLETGYLICWLKEHAKGALIEWAYLQRIL